MCVNWFGIFKGNRTQLQNVARDSADMVFYPEGKSHVP